MQILKQTGLNVIRLGVMWPGVEPQRGKYNDTYLQVMKNLISKLSQHNIFVLIDFHQDSLSQKFCGEGLPLWASIPKKDAAHAPFPVPIDEPYIVDNTTGIPSVQDCDKHSWDVYQITEAAASAYQSLYDNHDDIQDAFAQYWQVMAKTFQSLPNILGYDLMNEPFCGDIWTRPSLAVPGVADRENLQPMYDRVATAIRQIDTEHLLFFNSVTWDDFATGFTHVPGGESFTNMSVLAYHFYAPPNLFIEEQLMARQIDYNRLQCAGMLTEFDIAYDNGANVPNMMHTMSACDKYKQSWIGWEYKPLVPITGWGWCLVNPNGTVNTGVATAMSRTYARAVAGQVINMQFNNVTREYQLYYTVDPNIKQPTEIFVSSMYHYPNGFDVKLEPAALVTWQQVATDEIHILNAFVTVPTNVTVTITQK